MKQYVVFNQSTGEIEIHGTCQDGEVTLQARPGKGLLEGQATPLTHYVRGGKLVAYSSEQAATKSRPPSSYHTWSNDTFTWSDPRSQTQINDEAGAAIRNKRNKLLSDSDWTDTLSAKTRLGDALYLAWQNYRQALRDVTKQPTFPGSVSWPTSPEVKVDGSSDHAHSK